jgi:hypothetical protein
MGFGLAAVVVLLYRGLHMSNLRVNLIIFGMRVTAHELFASDTLALLNAVLIAFIQAPIVSGPRFV